jgi:predicted nuclease of predicted toxin-antitoxin system
MIFFADEGVDFPVVQKLRSEGHAVLYVAEMDPGISDEKVLAVANDKNALLLTTDKDFGELVYRLRRISAGLLLMRLAGLSPDTKAELVSSVVRDHGEQLVHTFTVVTPGIVRVRPRVI